MPWLTIALVPGRGYAALFGVLAILAACSSLLLFGLKRLD
jgi:hypothetical protein